MTPARSPLRTQRRSLLAAASLVAAVAVVTTAATLLGPAMRTPEQMAADAAPPPPSLITVAAERRVLVEPVTLRGQVRRGAGVRLMPPAAAIGPNSVVTSVDARAGSRVREGQILLERAGRPMFALVLPFPLYRDLGPGMRGPDVAVVQRALRRLGYDLPTAGTYDEATGTAVERFYADRGYSPDVPDGTAPSDLAGGPRLAQSDVLRLDRPRRRISSVRVRVGDILTTPTSALFELDRSPPTVVALATAQQARLLRVGQDVTVHDDGASGQAAARVVAIGDRPVAGADGQQGVQVRFRFAGRPLAADAERSVRVDVPPAPDAPEVLAVPVTAVYANPDGSSFVTVADPDGTTHDVTVRTGQVAEGWVEIADGANGVVAPGTSVVVGERTTAVG